MKPLRLAGASIIALVVFAPALLSAGGTGASGLSPLADAPPALLSAGGTCASGLNPQLADAPPAHLSVADESSDCRARQDAFRHRLLESGLTVVRVGSRAELALAVFHALVDLGPSPDAPARLAQAQALLASMPTDVLPERGAPPDGSRMPLASNPLFVGRGDELLQVARTLRSGDTRWRSGKSWRRRR